MHAFLLIVLLASLCLFGCLSEKDAFEARFVCVRLTSAAALDIPPCGSQAECVNAFDKRFDGIAESVFSFEARSSWTEFRNSVAQAWLFFNAANGELAQIRSYCEKDLPLAGIIPRVNAFKEDLLGGFSAIDRADAAAVSWMSAEHRALRDQRVEDSREEAVFGAFVELQSNLDAFAAAGTLQDEGVAVRLRAVKSRLSQALGQSGLGDAFVSSYSAWDLVAPVADELEARADVRVLVPQLFGFVREATARLSAQEKWSTARGFLERVDAFALFGAVSDAVGTDQSVAADFADLARRVSAWKKRTLDGIALRDEEIATLLSQADGEVALLSQTDSVFWSAHLRVLRFFDESAATRPSAIGFSVIDPQSAHEALFESVSAYREEYARMRTEWSNHRVALGTYVSDQKRLVRDANRVAANARFVRIDLQGAIVSACAERIGQASDETKASVNALADETASQIAFFSAEFRRETRVAEQVAWCDRVLFAYAQWVEQKAASMGSAWAEEKTLSCMKELKTLLPLAEDVAPWRERLSDIERSRRSDPLGAYARCEAASDQLVRSLNAQPDIGELSRRFENLRAGAREIRAMGAVVSKKSDLDWVDQKVVSLSVFFRDGQVSAEGLAALADVSQTLSNASDTAGRVYAAELGAYLGRHAQVRGNAEVWRTGEWTQQDWRITLSNPFSADWNQIVVVGVDLNAQGVVTQKEGEIGSVYWTDGALMVVLPRTAHGETRLGVRIEGIMEAIARDEVVFASSVRALVVKSVSVSGPRVPLVHVSQELGVKDMPWGELQVRADERDTPFWANDTNVVFELANGLRTAVVRYAVYEPLSVSTTFAEKPGYVEQLLSARNRTRWTLPKTVLFWPRIGAMDEKPVVWNSEGKTLSAECASDACRVVLGDMTQNAKQDLRIWWPVSDAASWAAQEKARLRLALEGIAGTDPAAAQLLGKLLETDPNQKTGREQIAQLAAQAFDLRQARSVAQQQAMDAEKMAAEAAAQAQLLSEQITRLSDANASLDLSGAREDLADASRLLQDAAEKTLLGNAVGARANLFSAFGFLDSTKRNLLRLVAQQEEAVRKRVVALGERFGEAGETLPTELFAFDAIDRLASQGDFAGALRALAEKERALETLTDGGALFEGRASAISERITALRAQLDAGADLLSRLRTALPSSDAQALETLGVRLSYTNQDISAAADGLKKIGSAALLRSLDAFDETLARGNVPSAIAGIDASALGSAERDLNRLLVEMRSGFDSIKNRAVFEVKTAVLGLPLGVEPSGDLALAEKKLESGEYGKALILVKKSKPASATTGLFGLSPDWPAVTVPVGLTILVVALYRWRQKEKQPVEKPKIRIERVQSEE